MTPFLDERIMELARQQHGVVTRAQLLGAGLGPEAVKYRVRTGRLRPLHRGVYLVGPILSPRAAEMAAVLACGPTAVISHRSAAALWGLLPRDQGAPVDVTVRPRDRRLRRGVRVHRGPPLDPLDVTTVDRVPTTTPARTVVDVAGAVGARELERAVARAERDGLPTRQDLLSSLARHPRRPGARMLRAMIERTEGPAWTRSEAEERFLHLLKRGQLPAPEVNVRLAGYEVDFLWRAERLVVEVDGFGFHASRRSFELDRLRDGRLAARGYQVLRVTWRQMVTEPEAMLVRLAQTLGAGSRR